MFRAISGDEGERSREKILVSVKSIKHPSHLGSFYYVYWPF